MAAKRWQVTTLSVLCVRDQRGKLDSARSLCLSVVLPSIPSGNSHGAIPQVYPFCFLWQQSQHCIVCRDCALTIMAKQVAG